MCSSDLQATRPSSRRGIEWSNRYIPRDWLLFDADFSLSRARFRDDDPAGNLIPGSINRVASLGATFNERGSWSGNLTLRYFGPRPLIADNSARSQSTLLWNSRVSYRIEKNLRLAVDVINLFDRKVNDIDYFYASQLRGEAASTNDLHFHPVEPRSLRVSLVANF